MPDTDRYTLISADTHALAADEVYRYYLDPSFRPAFDDSVGFARRHETEEPEDESLLDLDTQRNTLQEAQGVVGEVVFPDGRPPFYPNNVFLSGPPSPTDYVNRRAGVRALNRWMVDFCAQFPVRRAGVGSVLLNNLDDTITELEWIADHDLRGGIQLPNITPDVDWIPQISDRRYDRLWAACQDLDLVVNLHVEANVPDFGNGPIDLIPLATDGPHTTIRSVVLLVLSGVFDRFPRLRVTLSEVPMGVLSGLIRFLDTPYGVMRERGLLGTVPIDPSTIVDRLPSDYLGSNVWYTASPLLAAELDAIRTTVGFDHLMFGNDYPHPEGAYPFTGSILRQVFHDWKPAAVRTVLADTPAALYGFDLNALAAEAARVGPLVDEIATPLTELPDRPNYALVANAVATTNEP
ncbi:MAG TPA: amidohydrolase family protein [Acidimicrobiales bacterium]|nr:amidohydrolase family protein [Acidimicrobiales bacterium]